MARNLADPQKHRSADPLQDGPHDDQKRTEPFRSQTRLPADDRDDADSQLPDILIGNLDPLLAFDAVEGHLGYLGRCQAPVACVHEMALESHDHTAVRDALERLLGGLDEDQAEQNGPVERGVRGTGRRPALGHLQAVNEILQASSQGLAP